MARIDIRRRIKKLFKAQRSRRRRQAGWGSRKPRRGFLAGRRGLFLTAKMLKRAVKTHFHPVNPDYPVIFFLNTSATRRS
jgi:hypothetical protein